MAFPKCRGIANRKILVSSYSITPVAHVKLLPEQEFDGCCGKITDECYTFSYQSLSSSADAGLFHVGRHCANDFLTLTGKTAPPLFNPLTSSSTSGGGSSAVSSVTSLCLLNKEAYAAINLLTLEWGPPKSALQKILNAITTNPNMPISTNDVVHLNNIISKDKAGRTLTTIISQLKQSHPSMRNFSFQNIAAVLSNANKSSNF